MSPCLGQSVTKSPRTTIDRFSMEVTNMEISQELGRLWGRRLSHQLYDECCVQEQQDVVEDREVDKEVFKKEEVRDVRVVDGSDIGDFPAKYSVEGLRKEEFIAIGVYVDSRIVPGFKYRVRPIHQEGRERWLWKGEALELESIGRGYSRRLTFAPPPGGHNSNPHYFWADSWDWGFAFQIELVSPGDQFTVFDSSNLPVALLRIIQNQEAQVELSQRTLETGTLEKTARVKALVEVEWFSQDLALPTNTLPMCGRAVSVKGKGGVVTKVVGATLGGRTYTLRPGTSLRPTIVKGASIGDVPTTYTILGLEPHQLPVIGTYIDPRIAVGFRYRVSRVGGKYLWKEAVELSSIGKGYGKRMEFSKAGHLWSDTHPDGLGFEHAAVTAGEDFAIYAGDLLLGSAHVFRADAPQIEAGQQLTEEGLVKEVHVEITCTVVLDTVGSVDTMRVSGTAILLKTPNSKSARLLRIQDIGLESYLNLLFITRAEELVFLPL